MPYSPPTTTRSDAAQSAATHGAVPHGRARHLHPDMPGMSSTRRPIEVVRPERTIVRDVDQALPRILSSSALLLVLARLGVTLVRTRLVPRPGRSR